MKPTKPETELIEVIDTRDYLSPGKAKFKGKLLHPEVLSICAYGFLEVAMPAEYLFDFKAEELPEIMIFGLQLTQGECLGLLQAVNLSKKAKHVEMLFLFEIDEDKPPTGELNPYVIMPLLIASLKREKYKIKTWENSPGLYSVVFKVPFADNVYPHYTKHLAGLEKLCQPIEKSIIESLNKKWRKKLAQMKKA
jgi:hypothetical protein